MVLNWLDRIGDWNPQLFRELKGHLRWRNLAITGGISILTQLLVLLYFYGKLPMSAELNKFSRYCTGPSQYPEPDYYSSSLTCIFRPGLGAEINWPVWWLDMFVAVGIMAVFGILVLGVHLLITDLAKEERRGTLNFIQLSPRSAASILLGKMLGVPMLVYVGALSVVPLHLGAGLAAQADLSSILGFYAALLALMITFYSAALVYGLSSTWLGGFQPWLGSLASFLLLTMASNMLPDGKPMTWTILFSPVTVLAYVVPPDYVHIERLMGNSVQSLLSSLNTTSWLGLPIGISGLGFTAVMIANAALCTYWCWQMLRRQFHSPSSTLLSKRQGFWLIVCFEILILGFINRPELNNRIGGIQFEPKDYYNTLQYYYEAMSLTLVASLAMIAMLTPHRQSLVDWARYRHQSGDRQGLVSQSQPRRRSLWADLLWGERSPALVAIGINLITVGVLLTLWVIVRGIKPMESCISCIWLGMGMLAVYAVLAQIMLLLPNAKRTLWAIATVGSLAVVPPIALMILSQSPSASALPWLFTVIPWVAVEYLSTIAMWMGVLGQAVAMVAATGVVTRQLQKAGRSSTKHLIEARTAYLG